MTVPSVLVAVGVAGGLLALFDVARGAARARARLRDRVAALEQRLAEEVVERGGDPGSAPPRAPLYEPEPWTRVEIRAALGRILQRYPDRGWRMELKPGSPWVMVTLEPAWGEEATDENDEQKLAIWTHTGAVHRVQRDGAVSDEEWR